MAAIEAEDIIEDKAIQRPKDLANALKKPEAELDKLISTLVRYQDENKESTDTINKLIKRIDALEKEQKQLIAANKKLQEAVEKSNKKLEEQSDALEALDNRLNGAISRYRQLGKELLAIAKSPAILALAVIIGLIAAMTSAVKTFFTATGEGEDMLDKQAAVWNQFFATIKKGWAELGKDIVDFFGQDVTRNAVNLLFNYARFVFPFLTKWIEDARKEFNKTVADAEKLADKSDALADRMIENIIREAETRRRVNKLILDSADKLEFSDQQRLDFLIEAVDLQEKQMRINTALAKDTHANLLTEIGLRHGLTEEQTKRLTAQERAAEFTEEENKALAEALAKIIDMEGDYYQTVRKNASKIIALKQEIYKKDLEAAEKAAAARVHAVIDRMNQEIAEQRRLGMDGIKLESDVEEEILNIRRRYARLAAQEEAKRIRDILDTKKLEVEDRERLNKALYDLEVELNAMLFESFKENNTDTLELLQNLQMHFNNFAGSINSIFQSMTDKRLQLLDKEEERVNEQLERELKAAGDNEEAKIKLKERAEKRFEDIERQRVQLLRRAAIFEKAIAAAQAAINTAVAVTALLETPPLAIAAGIAGALQVAAILAEPLPAYAKGGITNTPYSLVGEEGIEKYTLPSGEVGYTPPVPTVMKFPIGTEITSNPETMRDLALRGMGVDSTLGTRQDLELSLLVGEIQDLKKVFKNKRELYINFGSHGAEAAIRNADNFIKILNEYYGAG